MNWNYRHEQYNDISRLYKLQENGSHTIIRKKDGIYKMVCPRCLTIFNGGAGYEL